MRWTLLVVLGVIAVGGRARARGDEPAQPARVQELTAQVEQLKAELNALRAENASLKQKLAEKEKSTAATTKPVTDLPAASFELGPEAKLGGYTYRAPLDWVATPVKDNKNGMLYRTPDKVAAILIQVRGKGAAPIEMQQKFAQNIVQMLKQDFVKNKTEVVEPPAAQADPRFYCRVHERIKLPDEKTADQTHYYLVAGKDMLEVTVISKAAASDQVAMTQRLAEDVLLSFKPAK